ncbi:MAG: AraC family transcriptional regulator [Clostridia bacterium]|nr:AraC family transcriptional regulator [Clostridia bacterium]
MKNAFECKRILVENIANSREKLLIRRKQLKNYDLHWHDCFEIELLLRGSAVQVLNGQRYEMQPGDIYLLNPTDFHSIETEGAVVYNIMFSEEMLDEDVLQKILSIDKNIIFRLSQHELHSAEFMISQMLYEFENTAIYSDSVIKNLMECLFILILRKCGLSERESEVGENDSIRKSVLYLHSRFRDNPTLEQVASVAGLNKNYFSGLFHESTGKTYKEYLNSLKLEHAKKLVLTSNIPVTEICFASGFNSLTNFLRVFKEVYNVSPTAMRKNKMKSKYN